MLAPANITLILLPFALLVFLLAIYANLNQFAFLASRNRTFSIMATVFHHVRLAITLLLIHLAAYSAVKVALNAQILLLIVRNVLLDYT